MESDASARGREFAGDRFVDTGIVSTNHPKIVHRRDLSFWEKLYLPQIFGGLRITLSQLFKPRFTRQYPEERWNPPPSFRGRPVLVEDGGDRKSTRLNSSHVKISYAVFCLKKKK